MCSIVVYACQGTAEKQYFYTDAVFPSKKKKEKKKIYIFFQIASLQRRITGVARIFWQGVCV